MRVRRMLPVLMAALFACAPAGEEVAIEPPQVLTDSVPFVYPLELWDHNIGGQAVVLVRDLEKITEDLVVTDFQ